VCGCGKITVRKTPTDLSLVTIHLRMFIYSLSLLMCVALTLLQHGEVHAIEEYNLTKVQSQMCFLTAVSSNHYYNVLKYISSTQKIYPCSKVYVYDLGNQSVNVYARACNISSLDVR
jgi:hypothetical protein